MSYQDQKKRATQKLDTIFRTGRISNTRVNISRGHKGWAAPLNPGWYGIPDGNRKYIVEPATIDIDDFLEIQRGTFGDIGMNSFMQGAYDPTVEKAQQNVKDIPTPVLEIKASGKIPQEGRSRALGAKRAGVTRMPIWLAIQVYR